MCNLLNIPPPCLLFLELDSGSRSSSTLSSWRLNTHSMNLRIPQITTSMTGKEMDVVASFLMTQRRMRAVSWKKVNRCARYRGTYFRKT